MATNTWNSTGSADWNTNGDWSAGAPPGTGDDVIIDEGIALIDAADGLIEVNGFTIDFGAGLSLDDGALTTTAGFDNAGTLSLDTQAGQGGSDLTVDGLFTNSGTLDMGGFDLLSPTELSVDALDNTGGTIDLIGAGSEDALIFIDDLNGVASLGGSTPGAVVGTVTLFGYQGGTVIEFESGQITTIESGATLSLIGAEALIEDDSTTGTNSALEGLSSNAGTFNVGDGASVSTTVDFDNSGSVSIANFDPGNSSFNIGGTLTNTGTIGLYSGIPGSEASLTVSGNAINDGTVTLTQASVTIGGSASADSGHTGTFDIGDHGILSFGGIADGSQTIDFTGLDGTLIFNAAGASSGDIGADIKDFAKGDTIQIDGFHATEASYDASTGVYTLTDQGTGASFGVEVGNQSDSTLNYNYDSATGDTTIISSVACFLKGTRILTDKGEVPVEALAIGDRVITYNGEAQAIKWLGHRCFRGYPDTHSAKLQPVRIKAGALGDGLPRRDLMVSPEHAMYLDRVLVPAQHLINGSTIVQALDFGDIEYFHVELQYHDVIFAEGAPTETYVERNNRSMFSNCDAYGRLYPYETRKSWEFCAERVTAGEMLLCVRNGLAEAAAACSAV